jgi:hypothetical protein
LFIFLGVGGDQPQIGGLTEKNLQPYLLVKKPFQFKSYQSGRPVSNTTLDDSFFPKEEGNRGGKDRFKEDERSRAGKANSPPKQAKEGGGIAGSDRKEETPDVAYPQIGGCAGYLESDWFL